MSKAKMENIDETEIDLEITIESEPETEIELSEEDYEFIKNIADSKGISVDKLIQEALQAVIDKFKNEK